MDQVTQKNAASVEQFGAAAEAMREQADGLAHALRCDRGEGCVERSLLTEVHAIQLPAEAASGNRHVINLVAPALANMMCARPALGSAGKLFLDLGYDYEEVRSIVYIDRFELVILGRRGGGETTSSAACVQNAGWSNAHIADSVVFPAW